MAVFKKVMIIDDDDLFLLVCDSIMEDENFAHEILQFDYADEAIKYLKKVTLDDLPEVLFLDINMPKMDGWELMNVLKELGIDSRIAIYVTSSSINPYDLEKAEKNPAIKGFICKPITAEKLKTIAESKL